MADEAKQFEAVFVENLPRIDRIVAGFGRRYGLSDDETAELGSWIKLRIVEEEYAVFRKFRGESSISTYLTVVVTMLAREQQVREQGRWRPSTAAQRHGPLATRLETLVHRKGYALSEAGETLRSRGETTLSDRELGELLTQLPRREPMRPIEVDAESLRAAAAADDAERPLLDAEASTERRTVEATLEGALAGLSLEDRLVLKLRFWQNLSVAEVARALSIEQKPLYRRIERLMSDLRETLTHSGVTSDQIRDLIGESGR